MRKLQRQARELLGLGVSIVDHRLRCATGKDIHGRISAERNKLALGSGDGRWVICPDGIGPSSVVYSFGIGRNITFDQALIERFGCKIYAFDPTPLALEWLRSQKLPEGFIAHPWGLASYDGFAVFSLPETHSVSFAMSGGILPNGPVKQEAECEVYRLPTLRSMLNHDRLDILKLDIEGAEYDVLDDLIADSTHINQLLIEFHHRWSELPSLTEIAIRRVEQCGLRLFHVSATGLEYSFVRDLVH